MRQFFLQSVYILWTRAHSVLSLCIEKKKKVWCSTLGDASELDWTSPVQTDTSAAERGWVCWGVQTADPAAKVCIPRQHSTVPRTVAHLLQQLMYRKLLGSSRAPLCAKVLGSNWKVHRMLPRSCLKNKKTSKESCTNQPTSQPTSQPASHCLRNKRINLRYWNWHEAAGWMPTYISNWDVISQKEKKKKKMTMKNWQCTVAVRSECRETVVHCGSNFQTGGGGIIKRVASLDFPYGSVCDPPYTHNVSQLNWKCCGVQVQQKVIQLHEKAQSLSINYPISGKL